MYCNKSLTCDKVGKRKINEYEKLGGGGNLKKLITFMLYQAVITYYTIKL